MNLYGCILAKLAYKNCETHGKTVRLDLTAHISRPCNYLIRLSVHPRISTQSLCRRNTPPRHTQINMTLIYDMTSSLVLPRVARARHLQNRPLPYNFNYSLRHEVSRSWCVSCPVSGTFLQSDSNSCKTIR